jgi:hypothetical protein
MFKLVFADKAKLQFFDLKNDKHLERKFKAVSKALYYLETNPRHPSLNAHKYSSMSKENKNEVFEAYTENKTPAAYRIFWHYGPSKNEITIIAITPHP